MVGGTDGKANFLTVRPTPLQLRRYAHTCDPSILGLRKRTGTFKDSLGYLE